MTPEQRKLTLGLAHVRNEPPELTPEQFLEQFGESNGQELASRLLAEAVEQQNDEDLWAAMRVVHAFGVTSEMLHPLEQAARGAWHRQHTNVVFRLQDLGDPRAIDVLLELTERVPAYVDEVDINEVSNNATWAIFKIGGESARRALERIQDSNDDEDRRELAEDLLERLQSG